MKALVGFMFFLLFLACIALVTLMGRQTTQQGMPSGSVPVPGSTWRPVTVRAESMPKDNGMFVTFETGGSIKGHGGCNGFFGSLKQTKTGLRVGPLGATRMACEEPIMVREAAFLEALNKTKTFRVGQNGMQALGEAGESLAEFVVAQHSD